jgi:hypothetical protein
VPARAPPAAYPHPLGHAGQHGAQARTAALVRAVLTRIAKQVRATLTLWAGFVTHANARVSASSSPHASPHTHTNFRRKSARTHVETASPPSENSP